MEIAQLVKICVCVLERLLYRDMVIALNGFDTTRRAIISLSDIPYLRVFFSFLL